jgi:hypothetical protein
MHTSSNRPWTENERRVVVDMLSDGAAMWRIAREIGRSPEAIKVYAGRHLGGVRHARTRHVIRTRNSREVAALMGWSCSKKVALFIASGALPAKRRRGRWGGEWLIDDTDLVSFLHDRRYWMAWDVGAITDDDLRQAAQAARDDAGGEWIRLSDWCKAHHYVNKTGTVWARKGYFASAVQWSTHWYVWSAELAAFTPPNERTRA